MHAIVDFYVRHKTLVDQIGINALLALSLSICLRAGQLALAQAALMGIGAYVASIAVVTKGWPLALAAPPAILASAAVGALLALPVGRLRGVYLAIATIGFGEIVRVVADNLKITGGAEGLSGIPPLLETPWIDGTLLLVGSIFFVLRNSRFALAIQTMREDESAAEGVGIDTAGVRMATLACAGAIAGCAGIPRLQQLLHHPQRLRVPTRSADPGVLRHRRRYVTVRRGCRCGAHDDPARSIPLLRKFSRGDERPGLAVGDCFRTRRNQWAVGPHPNQTPSPRGRGVSAVLQLDAAGVRYGGVDALAGVSLRVVPGEILGLDRPERRRQDDIGERGHRSRRAFAGHHSPR